jgi:hypothetical protein
VMFSLRGAATCRVGGSDKRPNSREYEEKVSDLLKAKGGLGYDKPKSRWRIYRIGQDCINIRTGDAQESRKKRSEPHSGSEVNSVGVVPSHCD